MNLLLEYKDSLVLVDTTVNGYGDEVVSHIEPVMGLFLQGTSQAESNYVERIGTDAHVYLDIENEYVLTHAFRLEGMYIIANIYGGISDEQWFKISRVKVGQRKLLGNEVNNVHCFLTKCEPLVEES